MARRQADLATVLGRNHYGFDAGTAFFTALRQDPILAGGHARAGPFFPQLIYGESPTMYLARWYNSSKVMISTSTIDRR